MTKEETFPIHRCVFRNDVDKLNQILKDEEVKKLINTKDNHGNTPIHLALMLDRRNCVISLIKNGCDCITRNNYGWNPLEEATMLGDIDLIEKLATLKFTQYQKFFSKKDGTLDEWNKELPYYHCKAHLKFKSKIPLLDKIGIKDTEHFYKRGNNYRFDFGFSGMDLRGIPRMVKGSMSLIFILKDTGFLRMLILDNKGKRYAEIYPDVPQSALDNYLKTKMDVKTMYKFFTDFSEFRIKKKSSKGFSFSNKKRVIRINGGKKYNTDIYKFKDLNFVIRKRDNEEVIGDYKSHIKTTVQDLDKSRTMGMGKISQEINNSIFSGAEAQLQGYVMEDILKQEKELSGTDSDSDSDDSDLEDDAKSESTNESTTSKLIEADNEFKKFIDANIFKITSINSELSDKVIHMIISGYDENGNAIEKSDILYINQIIPSFYINYIKQKRLPADEQKKLEEIYDTVVRNSKDISAEEKIANDSRVMQNIKKSNNVISMVHNIAGSYYHSGRKSSKASFGETKKEAIKEEEYFNPENKESLHMGRVMEINEEKKHVKTALKVWMTKENSFPICANQIRPFIDIVCLILFDQINIKAGDDDHDRNIYYNVVKQIFKEINGTKRFPLKLEIPVFAGTVFQLKCVDVDVDEKAVPQSLFEVPSDYTYDGSLNFSFIK